MTTITPNIITDGSYSGLFYAYEGSGGFIIQQGVGNTIIYPQKPVNSYDLTGSLQIIYDVKQFNTLLGLTKNSANTIITSTTFSEETGTFPTDSIRITAADFVSQVNVSEILSVGYYSSMYSNFKTLVNTYFGLPQNFNGLFTFNSYVSMNNGVFDASAMYNILHYSSQNASGQYVSDVSGSITVSNINSILRFACLNNPFGNRSSALEQNITPADGFLENDLVYVPSGTTITLVAKIINSDVTPNNIVPTNLQDIISTANNLTNAPDMFGNPDFSNGHYSQTTTFTASQIKRVIQVPLLLVLKNIIV